MPYNLYADRLLNLSLVPSNVYQVAENYLSAHQGLNSNPLQTICVLIDK